MSKCSNCDGVGYLLHEETVPAFCAAFDKYGTSFENKVEVWAFVDGWLAAKGVAANYPCKVCCKESAITEASE